MTGYFAAAGMLAALLRRATESGSYHVKVSLARSAMWVQELGFLDVGRQAGLPTSDDYPARTESLESVYGTISRLASPLQFSDLSLPPRTELVPYGVDAPSWLD